MIVVAVAGGLGDFGRLIVDALVAKNKYEVYVLTRKIPASYPSRVSPLTGKPYFPLLQTTYSSETELSLLLTSYNVHTFICAVGVDWPEVAAAQCLMIRAAALSSTVRRFIPSEFNVDYDLPDSILPYPEKVFHVMARRELESTDLEYTYIYPGMFMDYFGMPRLNTSMRALYVILDLENSRASVPGDGETRIAISYTKDVARYVAGALELEKWPEVLTVVSASVTANELVAVAEKISGRKLHVTFDEVEKLKKHEITVLPSNEDIAVHFPGGMDQLKALLADLSASMALGAYDFSDLNDSVDLVKALEGTEGPLMTPEKFFEITWGKI